MAAAAEPVDTYDDLVVGQGLGLFDEAGDVALLVQDYHAKAARVFHFFYHEDGIGLLTAGLRGDVAVVGLDDAVAKG